MPQSPLMCSSHERTTILNRMDRASSSTQLLNRLCRFSPLKEMERAPIYVQHIYQQEQFSCVKRCCNFSHLKATHDLYQSQGPIWPCGSPSFSEVPWNSAAQWSTTRSFSGFFGFRTRRWGKYHGLLHGVHSHSFCVPKGFRVHHRF